MIEPSCPILRCSIFINQEQRYQLWSFPNLGFQLQASEPNMAINKYIEKNKYINKYIEKNINGRTFALDSISN